MRNTKLRTLTVLDGDNRYSVRWDLSSFVKAAMMYAAHRPDYFKGALGRGYLEKVLKLYGVRKNRIEFTYENVGPVISVESSTEPGKDYKFDATYVCKNQDSDSIVRKKILCSCEGARRSDNGANVSIDKHVAESIILMGDMFDSNDLGVKRAKRTLAKVLRKMSEYDRPLKGHEINEIFYKEDKRLATILKEDLLTGSERSRFLRSSR